MPDALHCAIREVQADCSDILGAVLATPEGLVLASAGTLCGDVPAAAGTQIADLLDRNLSLLLGTSCMDALVWSSTAAWGVARLPHRHVVLVQAVAACRAAPLRLALARLRRDLGGTLEQRDEDTVGP
jgi:hypothetical protein